MCLCKEFTINIFINSKDKSIYLYVHRLRRKLLSLSVQYICIPPTGVLEKGWVIIVKFIWIIDFHVKLFL